MWVLLSSLNFYFFLDSHYHLLALKIMDVILFCSLWETSSFWAECGQTKQRNNNVYSIEAGTHCYIYTPQQIMIRDLEWIKLKAEFSISNIQPSIFVLCTVPDYRRSEYHWRLAAINKYRSSSNGSQSKSITILFTFMWYEQYYIALQLILAQQLSCSSFWNS
jgi:hypothetical protein